MKKLYFCILLATFLIPLTPVRATEPARPARAILNWMNHQISAIQEAEAQAIAHKTVNPGVTCFDALGWKIMAESRFKLGFDDLNRSIGIVQGNACLRNDIMAMDNRIQRMVRMIRESEITCNLSDLDRFENIIYQAFFLKNSLQEYGELKPEDEARARKNKTHPMQEFITQFGDIPVELGGEEFSLTDDQYRSTQLCPDPVSFFSFAQVKEQFQGLLLKLDQIKEAGASLGSMASGFSSGNALPLFTHDQSRRIREKGKYDAYAWFSRNIQRPVEDFGVYLDYKSEGPPLIEKQDKQVRQEIAKDKQRADDSVVPPRSVGEVVKDDEKQERSQVDQTMQEEDVFVKDSKEFLEWAIQEAKERQEVSLHLTEALEQPMITLPKLVDDSTKYLKKAYELMDGICRRDGACQ